MADERKTLKANLPPEVVNGEYANIVNVIFSPAEFIFDFGRMVPGKNDFDIVSRVIIAPVNAKKMLMILEENIKKFEKQFGEVKVDIKNDNVKLGF